jgi:hypothetical protein
MNVGDLARYIGLRAAADEEAESKRRCREPWGSFSVETDSASAPTQLRD